MKRMIVLAALVVASAGTSVLARQAMPEEQQRALRAAILEPFDVVPLTDGIALRPRSRMGDVRLIEISDAGISINGSPVTGRELRERLGRESVADAVLRLSYLDSETRRNLLAPVEPPRTAPDTPTEPAVEAPARPPDIIRHRRTRDRVRVMGDVVVEQNESIGGDVVAVLGSARVDGEVRNQVVAVLGSVNLGPNAVVNGDVVSVGGRVNRAPGSHVGGSITEVALGDANIHFHSDWMDWGVPFPFDGFNAVTRLIGSGFRFVLMLILGAIAFLLARPSVEAAAQRVADNPVKATIVGLAAQILAAPLFLLISFVILISIIGIPLFLLMPFAVLVLIIMALVGFTGVSYLIGQSLMRRGGVGASSAFAAVAFGMFLIFVPLFLGRLIAVSAWQLQPVAYLLIVMGLALEYVAWTAGFGAVIANSFARWQARRASRLAVTPH